MQTSKPYNRGHADALLAPCGEVSPWRIDDRGVWPAYSDYEEAKRLGLKSEHKLQSWKPVTAFQDDQNAPDCKDTPALPFPFDARDLAAFMLDGVGAFVAVYGAWEDGPETERLNDIDPSNNYARRAVREAFDAYRLAIEKVGKYDMDALARRDAAHTAYWKSSNDKALLKAFEDAEAEWDAAYQAWLTKMVRCLLEPQAAAPALHVATEPTQEQRQAYRWQLCIDAGLTMPEDTYSHLPRGIGKVAESLGITRQALQQDLNAHRERLFGK